MSNFKRMPVNVAGRDYVVGDIHGAYDLVIAGLHKAKFSPKVDRLFCVGDLIDRGPNSGRVLDFLKQPYVHAILGNHEAEILNASLAQIRAAAAVDFNGMGWMSTLGDEQLCAIQAAFAKLPVAMEIQTLRGTVGLVHAEVPLGMNWPDFVGAIEAGDHTVTQTALWGRSRIKSGNTQGVPGVDRLFVGHTVQWGGPRRLGNVYAMDTGAVFRELGHYEGSLSMAGLMCNSAAFVPKQKPASIELFDTPGIGPFGAYARPSSRS